MNKVFYAVSLLLLNFSSCKKSNDGNGVGTISATIDGTAVSFNTQAIATNSAPVGGVYMFAITGFQGAAATSNQIVLTVGGPNPIIAGTYEDVVVNPINDFVNLGYVQQPGGMVYGNSGGAPNTATVVIKSITATSVEGTFSGGVILLSGPGSPANHIITNGKFNLAIKN